MRHVLFLICLFFATNGNAQPETYTELHYGNVVYNVMVVRYSQKVLSDFSIAHNSQYTPNPEILDQVIQSGNNIFMINACISDSACGPIGWMVVDGTTINSINEGDGAGNFYLKPNGALVLKKNRALICETSDIQNHPDVRLGIQSGPMLLIDGQLNQRFDPASQSLNRRCGVGVYSTSQGEDVLVFAMANTPVSFYEFATFFQKRFKCKNALCLESLGCSMYFPGIQINDADVFTGTICNYIVMGM